MRFFEKFILSKLMLETQILIAMCGFFSFRI